MKLHLNKELFNNAIRITAQQMNINPIYVEKDYWVTLVLHTLYHSDVKEEVIFKGGTSLSKCFGLIDRFSEDIDLVVMREEGDSGNKLTNKIKKNKHLSFRTVTRSLSRKYNSKNGYES